MTSKNIQTVQAEKQTRIQDGMTVVNKKHPEWGAFLVKKSGFALKIISENGNSNYFDPQGMHLYEIV